MNTDILEKYGFPIAACLVLLAAIRVAWVFIQKLLKDHQTERQEMDRLHRVEREDFRRTIEKQFEESNKVSNNATQALTELTTLLKTRPNK